MDKTYEEILIEALKVVAPGTKLRQGLEDILRAKTGALIIIGDSSDVMEIVEGGFQINASFSPSYLYELAKMDGAIILNREVSKILIANAQLVPASTIPSTETGIRHRTAERVARQTNELVISISQRRNVITLYKGVIKYYLRDISVILTKSNQAIQILEKYKAVLDRALNNLSALEYDDLVTVFDVVKVLQRTEMVIRIVKELEKYITELGIEGRLIKMQVEELVDNVEDEGLRVIKDYNQNERKPEAVLNNIRVWSSEELLDLSNIARELGFILNHNNIDITVSSRGFRLLNKIPRLPVQVIENLLQSFENFQSILDASIEELDEVEGIGEVRARNIKDGLRRLREQIFLDRHI
ncbi:MAG: DNA integrity scanning diadenylate cyclase DisA [Peptococcaceae bacterium]